jgi:hypothetical protein
MSRLILLFNFVAAYASAFYSGYLIEIGKYALASVNIVTVIINLFLTAVIYINIVKDKQ